VRRKISARIDGGTSGHVKRAQTGSEDPHRREGKFLLFILLYLLPCDAGVNIWQIASASAPEKFLIN
jgi:hypothetical protein